MNKIIQMLITEPACAFYFSVALFIFAAGIVTAVVTIAIMK